jgi:hypothetical protein
MKIEYEHGLTHTQAYSRLENFRDVLFQMYGSLLQDYEYKWNEDKSMMYFHATARGVTVKGSLRLEERCIIIESDLPFIVRMILNQRRIEELARKQLKKLLAEDGPDYGLVLDI